MQRWIKLPDGRFIDANRVAVIGRPESYARYDDDGIDLGVGYSLQIGTDFPRDSQITVIGTHQEVLSVMRNLLVASPSATTDDPAQVDVTTPAD